MDTTALQQLLARTLKTPSVMLQPTAAVYSVLDGAPGYRQQALPHPYDVLTAHNYTQTFDDLRRVKAQAVSLAATQIADAYVRHLNKKPPTDISRAYAGTDLDWRRVPDPNEHGNYLTLDDSQCEAVELALRGESFALVGEAGKGKTLAVQAICTALYQQQLQYEQPYDFKQVGSKLRFAAPPIWLGAFTNIATGVLRNKVMANPYLRDAGFGPNIMTIHGLLEFAPVWKWSDQHERQVRVFEPQRTANNPLTGLRTLILDEGSMVGVGADGLENRQIWDYLYDALETETQLIIVGDINQVPPVGGKSILSYALKQLPVHELREFHRTAKESPVLSAAHAILRGDVPDSGMNTNTGSIFRLKPWTGQNATMCKRTEAANIWLQRVIPKWITEGKYDPAQDIWIAPMQKENNAVAAKRTGGNYQSYVSTTHINKCVASHLDEVEDRMVYTVVAGFTQHLLSVGDRILYNKRPAIVTNISLNAEYTGKRPPPPTNLINHLGSPVYRSSALTDVDDLDFEPTRATTKADTPLDIGAFTLDKLAIADKANKSNDADEGMVRTASHVVTIAYVDGDELDATDTLSTAGDFNPQTFSLGYAITVHKAQGSEWRKVFVILHPSHKMMLFRELLYTAVTRAKQECNVLGDKFSIARAIDNARIPGKKLSDKIEFFNGGTSIKYTDLSKLTGDHEEV